MRRQIRCLSLFMTTAFFSFLTLAPGSTYADTTFSLEQPVHFINAEGSDVVLDAGAYTLEFTQEWLKITPSDGRAVDALLLETQSATHEESLIEPLAVSTKGESPDVHHLALLLPGGKRLEAIGSYSGVRSRAAISSLTLQRLHALAAASRRNSEGGNEFSTPLFGGTGGDYSYNLDCGTGSVMVGLIHKSGSLVDAIGVICRRVNPGTGQLGEEFTRGPVGGSGGTARIDRCQSGGVIGEAKSEYGQFINYLSLGCFQWDASRKRLGSRQNDWASAGQVCHGVGFMFCKLGDRFKCPVGKAGKALRGRYGIYIDSTRFVCDDWDK